MKLFFVHVTIMKLCTHDVRDEVKDLGSIIYIQSYIYISRLHFKMIATWNDALYTFNL